MSGRLLEYPNTDVAIDSTVTAGARHVTSIEPGETLWLHWCPPLRQTVLTPDYNYCPECGEKLK